MDWPSHSNKIHFFNNVRISSIFISVIKIFGQSDSALVRLILRKSFSVTSYKAIYCLESTLLLYTYESGCLSQHTGVISHVACFPGIVRPDCLSCPLATEQLNKRRSRFFKRKCVLTQDEILVRSPRQNCWGWDLRGWTFWCWHAAHSALLPLRCLAGPQLGKNSKH